MFSVQETASSSLGFVTAIAQSTVGDTVLIGTKADFAVVVVDWGFYFHSNLIIS